MIHTRRQTKTNQQPAGGMGFLSVPSGEGLTVLGYDWRWIAGAVAAVAAAWWLLSRPSKAQRRRKALSAARRRYQADVKQIRQRYA